MQSTYLTAKAPVHKAQPLRTVVLVSKVLHPLQWFMSNIMLPLYKSLEFANLKGENYWTFYRLTIT